MEDTMSETEAIRLASIDVNAEITAAANRMEAGTALASAIEMAMAEVREALSEALAKRMLYQGDVAEAKARIAEGLVAEDASGLDQATFLYERADREVTLLRGRLDALKMRHTEAKARLSLIVRER